MGNTYSRAIARFWWILVLGILLAALAGIAVVVAAEDERTYLSKAELLVTSPQAPHFRISSTRFVEVPAPTSTGSGGGGASEEEGPATPPVLVNDSPDLDSLTRAANLYPLLITSDSVTGLRESMFGPLPGELTARGIYAVSTPGRFEPSIVPVIEITAEAPTPGQAQALVDASSKAFIRWIEQEQTRADLRDEDRIVIEQLTSASEATASSGTPYTLTGLVGIAVLAAFCALAIALDRLFPRKPGLATAPVEKPAVEAVDRPAEATKP